MDHGERPATASIWLLFLFLGLAWGSSYLAVAVGIDSLPTLTLVAGRLLIGTGLLAAVMVARCERLPRHARTYGHLLVIAVLNMVVPLVLSTAGQRTIDSSLAAILTATIPLITLVLALVLVRGERVSGLRLAGLGIGFVGVVVLVGPNPGALGGADVTGQVLVLLASVSYAAAGVYAQRFAAGLRPIVPAFFQLFYSALIVTVIALMVDRPLDGIAPTPDAVLAVVWLGVVSSGLAYLAYFVVLRAWGATRTSTIAYTMPVVGITLGVIVLGEPLTVGRIAGTALVLLGVALVDSGPALRRVVARRAGVRSAGRERAG